MKSVLENIFYKVRDFIFNDTKLDEDAKTLIISVRLILISIIVYFITSILFCVPQLNFFISMYCGIFLAAFAGLFVISYVAESKVVFYAFNIVTIAWIWMVVHFFGWDVGMQHFLTALLVISFFSSYSQHKWKIAYAAFLCTVRVLLFYAYRPKIPICQLSVSQENILHTLNAVAIFFCVSIIVYTFSKDSQQYEDKLVDYAIKMQEEAYTDTLTGLYNRRRALEFVDEYMAGKADDEKFCLCICDIDFFKNVNDTYGHDFGDEVLKAIAKIFKEEMREDKGFAARWGGEEFLLVFPGCNGTYAHVRVKNIRDRVKALRIRKDDTEVSVTMTFGLVEHISRNSFENTIKEADKKMYFGKENGRDRIVF